MCIIYIKYWIKGKKKGIYERFNKGFFLDIESYYFCFFDFKKEKNRGLVELIDGR